MKLLNSLAAATFGLVLLLPTVAAADDDSSAISRNGFTAAVSQSTAVIIRVPVDANHVEDSRGAELRLYNGADASSGARIERAWNEATPTTSVPQISRDDIASDSSTWGWNYYNSYYGYYGYNYYNYQPYYYSNYYRYSYSYPYYYGSYYNNYNYGYNYYYYPYSGCGYYY